MQFTTLHTALCKVSFLIIGKWMYEILLGSKGIMQLGWATLQCKFTNEVCLKIYMIVGRYNVCQVFTRSKNY